MSGLTFVERFKQARLYAAQVRVRRAMGNRYDHATSWRVTRINHTELEIAHHIENHTPLASEPSWRADNRPGIEHQKQPVRCVLGNVAA